MCIASSDISQMESVLEVLSHITHAINSNDSLVLPSQVNKRSELVLLLYVAITACIVLLSINMEIILCYHVKVVLMFIAIATRLYCGQWVWWPILKKSCI